LRELGDDIDDIGSGTAYPTTLQNSDMADTEAQAGSGQGSGRGKKVEGTRPAEAREEAMRQLDEAGTEEVFGWIAQHMVDNMGEGILQAVAGKSITGAQIGQAMSTRAAEEDCGTLHALFEYKVSMREIRALHAQLQEFKSLDGGEQTQATGGRRTRGVDARSFCCPWKKDGIKDQCEGCRKQREIQWGRARELLEQVLRQVSGTVKAATIVSREQAFFADQVEQAMQLMGPSAQGTVERTEEGDAMFQRFRIKYEEAIERERVTEETRRILEGCTMI